MVKSWEEPSFSEIKMDAEIGAYQDDFDPLRDPRSQASAPAESLEIEGAAVE